MTKGEFKFVRVAAGILHYGYVVVEVQQDAVSTEARLTPSVEIFGNGFRLTVQQASDWVEGALEGCREAVEFARRQGISELCAVDILRLNGSYVDTTEESMRITAFLALWEALTAGKKPLALTFEADRWQVTPA